MTVAQSATSCLRLCTNCRQICLQLQTILSSIIRERRTRSRQISSHDSEIHRLTSCALYCKIYPANPPGLYRKTRHLSAGLSLDVLADKWYNLWLVTECARFAWDECLALSWRGNG